MTTISELTVEIEGKEVGLSALLQKVDQQTQKAADSAIRLQAQYAKLAQAQGNTAGASKILSSALVNNGGASEQAIVGISTQLTKLQTGLQGGTSLADQFGGAVKSQILGVVGPAALATGAIAALKGELELAQVGAQLNATRASFDSLAASINTTGDALLTKLRGAAQGTVSDAKLIESANSGILLTGGKLASDLPQLLEIARASAKATGDDVGFVFDSLVKGIARGSPQIIDNAKITLDAAGAFDTYAKSIGKNANELTRAEQQQATLNAVLIAGDDIIKKTGGTSDGAAVAFARLATAGENLKNAFGQNLANTFAPVAGGLANVLTGLDGTQQGVANFIAGLGTSVQSLQGFGVVTQQQADSTQYMADRVAQGAQVVGEFLGILGPATAATTQNAQAVFVSADAEDRRAEAMRGSLIAQQASAAASINDAAAKQATTAQSQLLEAQIQAVAQSYLALNPNIDAAGVASAVAAGKIDAAVGVYINMTLATARARAELAALQGQAGVKGGAASVTEGRSERDRPGDLAQARAAGLAAERQRADAATAAEARYQQALGNNGPAIRRANAELAGLKKGTEAYYNKLTELEGLKKTKGGAGGGGAKLSDQQKLNNSLLADQNKFNDQYEDADLKHAQGLLKIQADYAEKMRAAQQQLDQDTLEGRASFYDNLGSVESDKIRQAASQQYEAASAEAGQIAAQKGADVADKYMQAQEQIISARAKRLSDIEKAEKDKDNGKADYLKGVDALHKQAEDAKLARIKEGDGSLAADRDKQIQDENQKYEESQGKIADSAERAADRKIAAADRAGKKIDEEQAKATSLAATYDKIAAAGAPTSGGAPVVPGSTPTAASGAAGAPADPVAAAIDGAREAIVAALAAIERATRETTGAVKTLKANGGVAG